jgi:hypothetical protein
MTAAAYWNDEALLRTTDEEYLESQARDIDRVVLRLQARIRGFLFRFHAGSIRRVPDHSFVGRERDARIQRKAKVDGAYQDRSTSSDGGPKKNANDDLKYAEAALNDPDFAERKIDDLPNGWVAACTRDGNPFFVETETSSPSWTHPRQSDASLLFGADFSLSWAWKQYFAHRKPGPSPSALRTPTIGELAVYFRAIEGRVEPGSRPRWWRESDPSCPSQPLCEVCRHINFDALFHTMDAWGDTSAIPLGSLRSIANKIHCAFCRLVAKTASPESDDHFRKLGEGKTIVRCNLTPNKEFSQFSTRIRTVHLEFQFPKQENPQQSFGRGRIHQILRRK